MAKTQQQLDQEFKEGIQKLADQLLEIARAAAADRAFGKPDGNGNMVPTNFPSRSVKASVSELTFLSPITVSDLGLADERESYFAGTLDVVTFLKKFGIDPTEQFNYLGTDRQSAIEVDKLNRLEARQKLQSVAEIGLMARETTPTVRGYGGSCCECVLRVMLDIGALADRIAKEETEILPQP